MITKLGIKGLKCFGDAEFDLKPLTLLSGLNSAGKSTFIQAILLVIQNITDKGVSPLNGHLVAMGDFNEAKNFVTNAKSINIFLENRDGRVNLDIYQDNNDNLKCKIKTQTYVPELKGLTKSLKYSSGHIHYISSDRVGIQDLYEKNYNKYENYGIKGEFAFDYYNEYKNQPLPDYLIKDANISLTLEGQLNYWLKYVLNCQLITEEIKGTDKIKVAYQHGNKSRFVRPKNIGTGLSYIISLMIAGLSSKRDELIIIENPEIHLHPKAQSRIAEFLAFLSNAGIQFIIETHSDHVFNGIRKAVKNNIIGIENTSIYFFRMDEVKQLSKPVKILLNSDGVIENHQAGLFDQFDDDLDELLGI